MKYMIACNFIFAGCLLVVLRKLYQIQHKQDQLSHKIEEYSSSVKTIVVGIHTLLRQLNGSVKSYIEDQNKFFNFASQRLAFNSLAIQWLLASLRPYLLALQEEAAEHDEFDVAQKWQDMVKCIDELIEHKFN